MLLGFLASLYSYFDKLSRPDNHFFFNIPPYNQSSIFDDDFLLLINGTFLVSADLQKHASFDAPGKKYIGSTYVTLNHLQMKKNKT